MLESLRFRTNRNQSVAQR